MNDGTWTYTWRHGRELSTMTDGTITVRNSYNPEGARIAKIVNRSNGSETHRYTYNGGKLVYDIIRINKAGEISNLTILMSYDESGRPFMITYDNVSYYYLLNAQGDVVGIMDVYGKIVVEYTYDAWGNVLSITGLMDPSAKISIQVNGRTRIPDALTPTTLTEVKNVKYISNTSQLKDFATFAKATGRTMDLYIRPTTKVAQTVINAGWNIHYLW